MFNAESNRNVGNDNKNKRITFSIVDCLYLSRRKIPKTQTERDKDNIPTLSA
jgi:hypothetical protein